MELNIGNITIILSIIGSLLGIVQQMKSMKAAQEKAIRDQAEAQAELASRLDALERSVASHNEYAKKFNENAKKFADLTSTIVEMKTDLRWIKDSLVK